MYGIHIAAAREKDLSALRELYLETRQSFLVRQNRHEAGRF